MYLRFAYMHPEMFELNRLPMVCKNAIEWNGSTKINSTSYYLWTWTSLSFLRQQKYIPQSQAYHSIFSKWDLMRNPSIMAYEKN